MSSVESQLELGHCISGMYRGVDHQIPADSVGLLYFLLTAGFSLMRFFLCETEHSIEIKQKYTIM